VIVLDASAVVELVLWSEAGKRVGIRVADVKQTLHAPHLLDVEVAQVLRRAERLKLISPERAAEALTAAAELDVIRYAHQPLLPRAWELRRNCTAYDSVYLALAEALDAPLLTLDSRLAAVPGVRCDVQIA
jgi:predicted nucleic acid-binding protein